MLHAALRVAGAIVLDALAFVIWNVAARTPFRMLAEARLAAREPRAIVRGVFAAVVGLIFLAAATLLVLPTMPDPVTEFAPVEFVTLLAALAVDALVGDELRKLV